MLYTCYTCWLKKLQSDCPARWKEVSFEKSPNKQFLLKLTGYATYVHYVHIQEMLSGPQQHLPFQETGYFPSAEYF